MTKPPHESFVMLFHVQNLAKSSPYSVAELVAEHAGLCLIDEKGRHNFTHLKMDELRLWRPENAPDWGRQELWNRVIQQETRENARYAKHITARLPDDWTMAQRSAAVRNFARQHFLARHLFVDSAIRGNTWSALVPTRRFNKVWQEKDSFMRQSAALSIWGQAWTKLCKEAPNLGGAPASRQVQERREKVAQMVSEGYTNKEIAKKLKVSTNLVAQDRLRIKPKEDMIELALQGATNEEISEKLQVKPYQVARQRRALLS